MFSVFLVMSLADGCSKSYEVEPMKPLIVSETMERGSVVCINTSYPNLAFILNKGKNDYEDIIFHTNHPNKQMYGPYTDDDNLGGFFFGKSIGSVEIIFEERSKLRFGAVVYSEACKDMVISSKRNEKIQLVKKNRDTLYETGKDRTLCYWYYNNKEIEYKIGIVTQADHDFLIFARDGFANKTYSGTKSDRLKVYPKNSNMIIWESDSTIESDAVNVVIKADEEYDEYVKAAFKQDNEIFLLHFVHEGLNDTAISLISVFSSIAVIVILIVLCACCGWCCPCCYKCCCCCCCCKNVKPKGCCCCKCGLENNDTIVGDTSSHSPYHKQPDNENAYIPPVADYSQQQPNVMYAPQYVPAYPQYAQPYPAGPNYPNQDTSAEAKGVDAL